MTITAGATVTIQQIRRADLSQDEVKLYPIPFTSLRVFDAITTLLPNAGGTDDLGLIGGTHGSATPSLQSSDFGGSTIGQKARFLWQLPPEYDAGQTIQIMAHGGMLTTVADTTATIDFSVFKSDNEAGVDGSDLVETVAQSINSLTLADKIFTLTGSGLQPGDWLDVLMTFDGVDSGDAGVMKGIISMLAFRLDIRG